MELIRGELPARMATLVYGQGGVGKTTLAASFPDPAFIQGESGSSQLDVARFPIPETWSDVLVQVRQAPTTGCKTVVIDTLDGVERLLWNEVCRENKNAKSIDLVGGGFGKGQARAAEKLKNELLPALDECLAKGVGVLLLSHCNIKRHNDPSGASYDRWAPAMAPAAWGAAYVWADNALFAEVEVVVAAKDEGGKALATGRRVLHTVQQGGFLAKNRRGMPPLIELPKDGGYSVLSDYFRTMAELRAELVSQAPAAERASIAARAAAVTERDTLVQLVRKGRKANAK